MRLGEEQEPEITLVYIFNQTVTLIRDTLRGESVCIRQLLYIAEKLNQNTSDRQAGRYPD